MRNILIGIIYLLNVPCAVGQCFQDRHSSVLTDCWISCESSQSPNLLRGDSHWILYDFDESHIIGNSHFWNINTPGHENKGAQLIAIDYSEDGQLWTEWGTLTLERGGQTGFYEGEAGPDFQGINAQYILLTILESYGEECRGLAEVRFESLGISTNTENTAFASSKLNLSPNPAPIAISL